MKDFKKIGSLGGKSTYNKYGRYYMALIGRRGGKKPKKKLFTGSDLTSEQGENMLKERSQS